MEILVKAKFEPSDVVYGYSNGYWSKFNINGIRVESTVYGDQTMYNEVMYDCTAIVPEDCEVTCRKTFEERQLYTKDELVSLLKSIVDSE